MTVTITTDEYEVTADAMYEAVLALKALEGSERGDDPSCGCGGGN